MYVARKPITVLAKQYKAGEAVPMDKLPASLRAKLIDSRRVILDDKKGA